MHISVCHLTMFSLCDFTVTWAQLMWVKQMDANMDGMIDFDEFVVATMHMHQLEENNSKKWQSRSSAAFAKLDMDGDGYITADELKVVSWFLFCLQMELVDLCPACEATTMFEIIEKVIQLVGCVGSRPFF